MLVIHMQMKQHINNQIMTTAHVIAEDSSTSVYNFSTHSQFSSYSVFGMDRDVLELKASNNEYQP